MKVRKTRIEDIDVIMPIYEKAKAFMLESGNTQWAKRGPTKEKIIDDIINKQSYVILDDNKIVGVFTFFVGKEPTYEVIENRSWLNDEKYGVIHRIASSQERKGILNVALKFAFKKINNIRIDTHKDNKVMRHLLEKYGFIRCGIIYVEDKSPRIAYQICK